MMRGDNAYIPLIVILSIALFGAILVARAIAQRADREHVRRVKAEDESRKKDQEVLDTRKAHAEALSAKDTKLEKLAKHMAGLMQILKEKTIQFPWLASAIADFHALEAEREADMLESKRIPATKAAVVVREHGRRRREAEFAVRLMRYRIEYYEKLFPWVIDYVGDDVPDAAVDVSGSLAQPTDDPVKAWLNDAEYQRLSAVEKNQLALDRWRVSRKSNWEIGRDYERYIGYEYERLGYDVTFTGAIEGLQDMGRDLIARRSSDLRVIQCKYWSQEKTIHEKHIFQLFGSALEYAFRLGTLSDIRQLSLFGGPIKVTGAKAVLYTSTSISDVAKQVAKTLDVECNEKVPLADYPLVKCNISMRDGQKIYHLPFDQQYDRTKIKVGSAERYVRTVEEAENAGFRRAWKWRPEQ